jgi:hypothetical protein
MDTAVKVRQWWIEHDVNRSLSYYLDATLLREAGEIKLQEMPEICTTNSRYNSKEKKTSHAVQ